MRTVLDAIVDQAGGDGTLTFLDATGDTVTALPWRAVHDRARRTSAVLADCGVRPGCRVGLLGETSVDLVAALQAVWLTGAAVTVLPVTAREAHRLAIARDAELDLVVTDLRALSEQARGAAPAVPYRPAPGELALLQYTSGSTRSPRGVPVSHGQLATNVAALKVALDHDATHHGPTVSWLPLYHDMGLIAFFILPMSCGCRLVLQPPTAFARRPGSWLEAMSRHRATISGAPNFAYALMTQLLASTVDLGLDLTTMRCLVTGGEPVDAGMMARFTAAAGRYGLSPSALLAGYGLAEATLGATVSPPGTGILVDRVDASILDTERRAVPAVPGRRARELVRVGRPVLDTELRITDPRTGAVLGDRMVGRIELRGAAVVGHYWRDPPPAPGSWLDTWLDTGDLGYLTGGELVVCGREKDVLFAAGRNVYPQDIEAAAAEVPGVRIGGAVAFGLPGERGDRLVVAVEYRDADPERVRRGVVGAVLDEVGLAPDEVLALRPGRLPKTTSGKPRRAEARRRYLASELGG